MGWELGVVGGVACIYTALPCIAVNSMAFEGIVWGMDALYYGLVIPSKASGYGVELRNLMLAFSRMHDTEYVRKVHICSHPLLLALCLPACLTEKEGRYPFSRMRTSVPLHFRDGEKLHHQPHHGNI